MRDASKRFYYTGTYCGRQDGGEMETFIWALSLTVTLLLAVVMFFMYRSAAALKRAAFIREYVFPQGLLARLAEKRPQLTLKEQQLVTRGLRQFFLCNLMAKGAFVSMPS